DERRQLLVFGDSYQLPDRSLRVLSSLLARSYRCFALSFAIALALGVVDRSYVALSARSAAFAMHWMISSRSLSASVSVTRDGSLSLTMRWLAIHPTSMFGYRLFAQDRFRLLHVEVDFDGRPIPC